MREAAGMLPSSSSLMGKERSSADILPRAVAARFAASIGGGKNELVTFVADLVVWDSFEAANSDR